MAPFCPPGRRSNEIRFDPKLHVLWRHCCRQKSKPMIKLLTSSFQLDMPDAEHGRVCGNATAIKSHLCSPPEVVEYYKVCRP